MCNNEILRQTQTKENWERYVCVCTLTPFKKSVFIIYLFFYEGNVGGWLANNVLSLQW